MGLGSIRGQRTAEVQVPGWLQRAASHVIEKLKSLKKWTLKET